MKETISRQLDLRVPPDSPPSPQPLHHLATRFRPPPSHYPDEASFSSVSRRIPRSSASSRSQGSLCPFPCTRTSSKSPSSHYGTTKPLPNLSLKASNAANFTLFDCQSDIKLAQAAEINAFVLNVAATDPTNNTSLALAFKAAESLSFHVFLSFRLQRAGRLESSVHYGCVAVVLYESARV